MPRANRYLIEGQAVHVTHRCHNKAFLFQAREFRSEYRERLRKNLKISKVRLLGYSITRNHVHLLFQSQKANELSNLMKKAQGEFAQSFNQKQERLGAFWADRFHATMIQADSHLWSCLRYIDLNMVRAGIVKHPSEWKWCGYHELVGRRKRFRLIDLEWLTSWSGAKDIHEFQRQYTDWVESGLSTGEGMSKEPCWGDSIAVGTREYVSQFENRYPARAELSIDRTDSGIWSVREAPLPYRTEKGDYPGSKAPIPPRKRP